MFYFIFIVHINLNRKLIVILLKMKTYFKNIVSTYFYKSDRNIFGLLSYFLKDLNFQIPDGGISNS